MCFIIHVSHRSPLDAMGPRGRHGPMGPHGPHWPWPGPGRAAVMTGAAKQSEVAQHPNQAMGTGILVKFSVRD